MEPAADFALPTLDVRALARRAALPAIGMAAIATALIVAGGPLETFAHALRRALAADPRWVAAAAVFELLSFAGYVALLWLVGSRASHRLGLRQSAEVTLGGAAATRLLPTAGVGGAALTLVALRRTGIGSRAAGRTLLTFLVLLYAVFLGSIAIAGAVLALQGTGPIALCALPAAGAAIAIAIPLGLCLRPPAEGPGRVRSGARLLGEAVGDAIGFVRAGDPRLLGAIAWWAFDAAVLGAMLHAFGAAPSPLVFVFAYFVGQAGNTVPVPGAVSGGIVGVLLAFGVDADVALVSVLGYRCIAIWLPAPIGLLALTSLRRTLADWAGPRQVDEPGGALAWPDGPSRHPAVPCRPCRQPAAAA